MLNAIQVAGILGGAVLALSAVIAAPGTTTTIPSKTGDPVAGRKVWDRAGCWTCHGYAAQGGLETGPALTGKPYPPEVFLQIVRRPYGVMPPYTSEMLSDDEVRDILAYVRRIDQRSPAQ